MYLGHLKKNNLESLSLKLTQCSRTKLVKNNTQLKTKCNIPHREKSFQSQGILRQLVPNLEGRVLGPVNCQEQNREAWKPSWAKL